METIAGDAAGQVIGRIMSEVVAPTMFIIAATVALVYIIPTVIAFIKRRKDRTDILLINVFWGWTVVGWFVALIRALGKSGSSRKKTRRRRTSSKTRRSSKKNK